MALIPAHDVDTPTSPDIQHVYREWYDETAVRATLVDHGMLIVPHKGPQEIDGQRLRQKHVCPDALFTVYGF